MGPVGVVQDRVRRGLDGVESWRSSAVVASARRRPARPSRRAPGTWPPTAGRRRCARAGRRSPPARASAGQRARAATRPARARARRRVGQRRSTRPPSDPGRKHARSLGGQGEWDEQRPELRHAGRPTRGPGYSRGPPCRSRARWRAAARSPALRSCTATPHRDGSGPRRSSAARPWSRRPRPEDRCRPEPRK